jgi:hypothetical protein
MLRTNTKRHSLAAVFLIAILAPLLCSCLSRGSSYLNSFADVGIHLTVLPKGVGDYANLPDPVWIAAGGVLSPAHQADVVITIDPPDVGRPVHVQLINGKGRERHARLVFSNQVVMPDGDPVFLRTNETGVYKGVLTSSDTEGSCTVQIYVPSAANKVQRTVLFNHMWEGSSEFLNIAGFQERYFYHGPEVGLITNTMQFVHYRAPDHNAPKRPLDNHEIRCYVEDLVYLDENRIRHRIINTPDNPTDTVNDWAVFLSPAQTDSNGYASVVLDVRRSGIESMEIVTYSGTVYCDPTPKYDSRYGIKLFDRISFNDASLQDVVLRLNQHLGADDAYSAEHARDMQKNPIRQVQLELPDGMPGGTVTVSFADIEFDVLLGFVTSIADVSYHVDGHIIRIAPWFHHRPIPHDELKLESVIPRLESAFREKGQVPLYISEAGLAKAIENGWVESRFRDMFPADQGKTEQHILTESGKQRFGAFLPAWCLDGRDVSYSCLMGTPVVGSVRLLRASFETNATGLVFSDYESNEPVPIDLDSVQGVFYDDNGNTYSLSNRGSSINFCGIADFLQQEPSAVSNKKLGIYVYYDVGVEQFTPEDKNFFNWGKTRLEQLFDHEFGYFVRVPRYLVPSPSIACE